MEKTIYVTVAEFLENGGGFEPNRAIYDAGERYLGKFAHMDLDWIYYRINDNYTVKKISELQSYVEIPCTPIYK